MQVLQLPPSRYKTGQTPYPHAPQERSDPLWFREHTGNVASPLRYALWPPEEYETKRRSDPECLWGGGESSPGWLPDHPIIVFHFHYCFELFSTDHPPVKLNQKVLLFFFILLQTNAYRLHPHTPGYQRQTAGSSQKFQGSPLNLYSQANVSNDPDP